MKSTPAIPLPSLDEAARWAPEQVVDLARAYHAVVQQVAALQHQLDWFRRQIFGQKSEKRLFDHPLQMSLGEIAEQDQPAPPEITPQPRTTSVRKPRNNDNTADESGLFFDEAKVPVEIIHVANPEMAKLSPDQYEVIGEKVSYRLAQQPGSHVVLKYVRPLIKRLDTQELLCPPAPMGVIEGSRADVSFIAGLLLDKFAYHLPLYRQHQRLQDAGFKLSRPWLTQLAAQGAALLAPIYEAQLASIRASRVKAMDETPIKGACRAGQVEGRLLLAGLRRTGRGVFPVLRRPGAHLRGAGAGAHAGGRRRAALGRIRRLRALCREDRADPCPVLGAHTA